MDIERIAGKTCGSPFPLYADLVEVLAAPTKGALLERHDVVAHALGICAGYAYADLDTLATMMARVGFEAEACVRVSQTVDAMFIYSTAYLLQSRCGRVAILCYRGTEASNLGNWLGDAEVGSDSSLMSGAERGPPVRVHAGFHLNVRATWWPILEELRRALRAGSILDPGRRVEHPLEALYVAGHSLGGAMAVLFGLGVGGQAEHDQIGEVLRAIYTYGQPMTVCEPLPRWSDDVAKKLIRHVLARDPVPTLPPEGWGPFAHIGQEFQIVHHVWRRSEFPVSQAPGAKLIARSILDALRPEERQRSSQYLASAHGPQHYIAALRPPGRISELGDLSSP